MTQPREPSDRSRRLIDEFREIASAISDAYNGFARQLGAWFEKNQDTIAAVLESMQVWAALQPEMQRLLDEWKDSEWGHLLSKLDFVNAFCLLLLLDQRDADVIEAALEGPLTDAEFLADLDSALGSAPLSVANRRQLAKGLAFIGEHDYELAVPLLILPLEGAFWRVAQDRGLVERVKTRMHFTSASGHKPGREARGVEAIFEPLGVDEDFRAFLVRLVYGGRGHPFRHGNAEVGWRHAGLMLVIALVGWLDLYASTEDNDLLLRTFERNDQALEGALELLPPLGAVAARRPEAVETTINVLMSIRTRTAPPDDGSQ
jgi:hypothetical protein